MKSLLVLSAAALLLAACQTGPNESVVGSGSDTEIRNVSFVVDTTYIVNDPAGMIARGTAMNNGTATITTGWYVEGQFYTDATKRTKLGGNTTMIGVPLSPGQQTFWTITFSTANADVRSYPGFAVGDLRAIYKK